METGTITPSSEIKKSMAGGQAGNDLTATDGTRERSMGKAGNRRASTPDESYSPVLGTYLYCNSKVHSPARYLQSRVSVLEVEVSFPLG